MKFYRRTNLGILLGAAVATAVLAGALVVGDSVGFSLQEMVRVRLGQTTWALSGGDRFFRAELAGEMGRELNSPAAGILQLSGALSNTDGSRRANQIEVLGVDKAFWAMAPSTDSVQLSENEIMLNNLLAGQLQVDVGDEVLLRVNKPSLLSRESIMATVADQAAAIRLKVKSIVTEAHFGHFSLKSNQVAPLNAFLSREVLADMVDLSEKANVLLLGDNQSESLRIEALDTALKNNWRIADAELQWKEITKLNSLELRSGRIFLEPAIVATATGIEIPSTRILTYFANEIRFDEQATPYSTIAALEKTPYTRALIPPDMTDDEIVINDWLAQDLQVKSGDTLELTYFVTGEKRKLQEQTSEFKVRNIVPMEGLAADAELMPDFEGLAEVANCRDWEPGMPVDLDKIREKDEYYWDQHRGTPKAFITLAAGQKIWANQFGDLTAIRYPLSKENRISVEKHIQQNLDPGKLGFFFQPVRQLGQNASQHAMDFGGLFLGLSFFLIISGLLLMGLLFVFGIQQRRAETGILMALGFTPGQVQKLLLGEGLILAVPGSVIGTVLGLFYTRIILHGLASVWLNAVGSASIRFHAELTTILMGAGIGIIAALLAMWLMLLRQGKRPPRELMANVMDETLLNQDKIPHQKLGLWISLPALATAVILVALGLRSDDLSVGSFFGAGSLLLLGFLGLADYWLRRQTFKTRHEFLTFKSLAQRNMTRRHGRSLAVIALLACGCFVIIAVGANRHDALKNAFERSSGTGGFALIAETTLPVYHDLNSPAGQKEFALDPDDMSSVEFVPLRLRDGDDASCLNLNRPQQPQVLGVNPDDFISRKAFSFVHILDNIKKDNPWSLLYDNPGEDDVIYAITDYATIKWSLGKTVGDDLFYTDKQGKNFKIRLAGGLQNSILQGSLIISENNFIERFGADGYRMLLIDCAPEKVDQITPLLARSLRKVSANLTPAFRRLASFYAVENTYLSIFQILGSLGMVLGSIGLGLVVARNVLERRSELAMLRAVGYNRSELIRLIIYEHITCLLLGLGAGVIAALVAVLPALRFGSGQFPIWSLTVTLVIILTSGILWTSLAAILALRGELINALRNE
ncbi:MAG: FtsX-like permease family protein [Sedimentisphaerales bacterium]|nr:FtsX-like permease family protein [Sedimentisphaerales bacterium]